MDKEVLNQLYDKIGLPDQEREALNKEFSDIFAMRFGTELLKILPDDKLTILMRLIVEPGVDLETLEKQLTIHGFKNNREIVERFSSTLKLTLNDFIDACTEDLEPNQKDSIRESLKLNL